MLRKDFIAEPYQVFEARAAGADLVLLIAAALEQPVLAELHELIAQLGMTALVETHSADEVERALDVGASVVGVNARDLSTFELDRELFGSLADRIPSGVIRIAESAVTEPADVARYRAAGADVVLVGEALVTGDDQQNEVGAGSARLEHLVRLGDEVLAQHGDVDRRAHRLEVGQRPEEAAALGQHADRTRPTGLVRDGEGSGVRDVGERPAGRAGPLHLGDDLHAIGGREGRHHVQCGRARCGIRLDLLEGADRASLRGVRDGPGDEFGEHSRNAPSARNAGL